MTTDTDLRITEIFLSLQGETSFSGLPTVFVRLTGCPMRCVYCDSAYAFHGGKRLSQDAVMQAVRDCAVARVTVTGGEPLAQPACWPLLARLCDEGFAVSLETGGGRSTAGVDERVVTVLDIKTPASGECDNNDWSNLPRLHPHDQVKFVLADRADYDWACSILKQHRLDERVADVLFSPVANRLPPRQLADWIVADRLPVRLQIQLHKLLWGDEPGR